MPSSPPDCPEFTVVMDLDTVFEVTGEYDHLACLLNTRITLAGGVRESELEAFIFAILEDLEGRLRDRLPGGLTSAGLKETVSAIIDEMLDEGADPIAVSHDGGKTWIPLEPGGSEKRGRAE